MRGRDAKHIADLLDQVYYHWRFPISIVQKVMDEPVEDFQASVEAFGYLYPNDSDVVAGSAAGPSSTSYGDSPRTRDHQSPQGDDDGFTLYRRLSG